MNALARNDWTEGWRALGASIPRPRAIVMVSAHWYVDDTAVTAMSRPRTIHDFGGFPGELYRLEYPAPGDPGLASELRSMLTPTAVTLDQDWGLDHGTWSVLRHAFPDADVPVVQLSLDETQPAAFHYELGTRLAPLRHEGVLVMGSGNVVHNLHAYGWGRRIVEPYDWAVRFETRLRERLLAGDRAALVGYESLGRDAELSVPTPDHYLPFLYALGAHRAGEPIAFPVEGFDGGSVSMLSVRFG